MLRYALLASMSMWVVFSPGEGQAGPAKGAVNGPKRIVFYYQGDYPNICQPEKGFRSLSPLWESPNPATGKPYATHVILAAFNMGPTKDNPSKLPPYIHRNDFPVDDPVHDAVRKEIKTLQSKGVRVLMLLGGAGAKIRGHTCGRKYDNDTWAALNRDKNTYYGFIKSTIEKYNFDGIDLNVENEDLGADTLVELVRQLRADFSKREKPLIITFSPVASELTTKSNRGFSKIDYAQVYKQVGEQVDWVNGQFYADYSGRPEPEVYKKASEVFPPEKLVMGTWMEYEGYKGKNYDKVMAAIRELAQAPFGGVAMWEYMGTPRGPAQWSKDVYEAMNAEGPP